MATLVETHTETMTTESSSAETPASSEQSSQPNIQQPTAPKEKLTWQTVPKEIKVLFIEKVSYTNTVIPLQLQHVC